MRDDQVRDAVLLAFQTQCPRPKAGEIAEWALLHPGFADDIREHAELMLEAVQRGPEAAEPSAALMERARTRALDAAAAARERSAAPASAISFADLMAAAETGIPRLARQLDIGRAVLTDLVQGRMRLPLKKRLAAALADQLRTTTEAVRGAASLAASSPSMGQAKARGAPAASPRSFEEIVREDPTMSAAGKSHWLED